MVEVRVDRYSRAPEQAGWLELPGGPWKRALLKPNWVRHFNELAPEDASRLAETVTAPELILAVGRELSGRAAVLDVGDAPQFDTDWDELARRLDLAGLEAGLRAAGHAQARVLDLRQEVVRTDAGGVILERRKHDGDPLGYRIVDLGARSAFASFDHDVARLRGADYDAGETIRHHSGGRHEYCVSASVLAADLVVDLPKAKTHKKAGVTLCLKNLVGINGNKNYLPHHRAGAPSIGGDEFPDTKGAWYRRLRAMAVDAARPLLAAGRLVPLFRKLRALDLATRPKDMVRNGNWWGNDTVWRMVHDLNRILLYADADGLVRDTRQRQVHHVIDGLVGGEGDGPLAPDRKGMGLVVQSRDAVAADLVTAALMGFDPFSIPIIREALAPHVLPISELGPEGEGLVIRFEGREVKRWQDLPDLGFRAHPGWAGRIERTPSAASGGGRC